jgi:hypothetical protein
MQLCIINQLHKVIMQVGMSADLLRIAGGAFGLMLPVEAFYRKRDEFGIVQE